MLRKSGVATKPKSRKSKATSQSPASREVKGRASHTVLSPQLRVRLKSEHHSELFRTDNGKEPGADLRTVVLSRRTVKTCQLFR